MASQSQALAELIVKLSADPRELQAGLNKAKAAINSAGMEVVKFDRTTRQSGRGLMTFGQTLNDVQQFSYGAAAGIRAISNNLPGLIEQLGGAGKAGKALQASLGWISLAVTALSTAFVLFGDKISSAFGKATTSAGDLKTALDDIVELQDKQWGLTLSLGEAENALAASRAKQQGLVGDVAWYENMGRSFRAMITEAAMGIGLPTSEGARRSAALDRQNDAEAPYTSLFGGIVKKGRAEQAALRGLRERGLNPAATNKDTEEAERKATEAFNREMDRRRTVNDEWERTGRLMLRVFDIESRRYTGGSPGTFTEKGLLREDNPLAVTRNGLGETEIALGAVRDNLPGDQDAARRGQLRLLQQIEQQASAGRVAVAQLQQSLRGVAADAASSFGGALGDAVVGIFSGSGLSRNSKDLQRLELEQQEKQLRESLGRREITHAEYDLRVRALSEERAAWEAAVDDSVTGRIGRAWTDLGEAMKDTMRAASKQILADLTKIVVKLLIVNALRAALNGYTGGGILGTVAQMVGAANVKIKTGIAGGIEPLSLSASSATTSMRLDYDALVVAVETGLVNRNRRGGRGLLG